MHYALSSGSPRRPTRNDECIGASLDFDCELNDRLGNETNQPKPQ